MKDWRLYALDGITPLTEIDFGLTRPGEQAEGLGMVLAVLGTEPLDLSLALLEVPGSVGEGWYTGQAQLMDAQGLPLGEPQAVRLGGGVARFPGVQPGQSVRVPFVVDVPVDAPLDFSGQPALLDIRAS